MSAKAPSRTRAVGRPIRGVALRTRLRGVVGPAAVSAWAVALAGVVLAVYVHQTGTDQLFRQPAARASVVGRAVGQWLVLAATAAMLVIVPACTAGSIAGARERHTLAPWLPTFVHPRSIVSGHLASAAALIVLLVGTAAPFAALAAGLGGASPGVLATGLGGVAVTGLVVGCISLAVSAWCRRTSTALLLTWLLLALLVGGSAVLHAAGDGTGGARGVDAVLLANPVVAVADASWSVVGATSRPSATKASDAPLDHLARLVHRPRSAAGPLAAAWPTSLGAALLLSLVALLVAVAGVRRRRHG